MQLAKHTSIFREVLSGNTYKTFLVIVQLNEINTSEEIIKDLKYGFSEYFTLLQQLGKAIQAVQFEGVHVTRSFTSFSEHAIYSKEKKPSTLNQMIFIYLLLNINFLYN